MDEQSSLIALQRGSEDALAWFIRQYTPYVSTVAGRILSDRPRADTEEVVADVFLALWHDYGKVKPGRVKAWLSAVARNTAINKLRSCGAELELDEDTIYLSSDSPGAKLEREELRCAVQKAVLSLPQPDKEIFLRHYYYCEKLNDIAHALNMKEATVKTKLHRGRKVLGRLLEEGGFTLEYQDF